MPEVVTFYRVSDDYGCFSNFAPYPIRLDGKLWPSSEHYFQAQKFADSDYQEWICNARSPMIAARLGRSRKRPLRQDWESIKWAVMRKAVHAKFVQHADIRRILMSTGDARIVEHSRQDVYWGDGGDGSGENMLGKVLVEIREQLRGSATDEPTG